MNNERRFSIERESLLSEISIFSHFEKMFHILFTLSIVKFSNRCGKVSTKQSPWQAKFGCGRIFPYLFQKDPITSKFHTFDKGKSVEKVINILLRRWCCG